MVSLVPITSISFDLHAKKKNPKSRLQRNKKKAERKAKEKREKAKKEQKKTMELVGRISLVFLWLDYLFPILLDWLDRFRGDTRGYVFWFGLMGEEFPVWVFRLEETRCCSVWRGIFSNFFCLIRDSSRLGMAWTKQWWIMDFLGSCLEEGGESCFMCSVSRNLSFL